MHGVSLQVLCSYGSGPGLRVSGEQVNAVSARKKPEMPGVAHVSRVRALYKRILVLHRFLPLHLRALGDQYVKGEFRRHKEVTEVEAGRFMAEWEVSRFPL